MFALLWLIASSAWATGVSNIKHYTDPTVMIKRNHVEGCDNDMTNCKFLEEGNFASLNVSLVRFPDLFFIHFKNDDFLIYFKKDLFQKSYNKRKYQTGLTLLRFLKEKY